MLSFDGQDILKKLSGPWQWYMQLTSTITHQIKNLACPPSKYSPGPSPTTVPYKMLIHGDVPSMYWTLAYMMGNQYLSGNPGPAEVNIWEHPQCMQAMLG